jgi:hypothetical protein
MGYPRFHGVSILPGPNRYQTGTDIYCKTVERYPPRKVFKVVTKCPAPNAEVLFGILS